MATAGSTQEFLDNLFENVRSRAISWASLHRATGMTPEQFTNIQALYLDSIRTASNLNEAQPKARAEVIDEDAAKYVKLFFGEGGNKGLLDLYKDQHDTSLSLVVCLGDALTSRKFQEEVIKTPNRYAPLVRLLNKPDLKDNEALKIITSRTLGIIISYVLDSNNKEEGKEKDTQEPLEMLYRYLAVLSDDSTNAALQDLAVQGYVHILRAKNSRETFWSLQQQTVKPLIKLLERAVRQSPSARPPASQQQAQGQAALQSAVGNRVRDTDPGNQGGVGLQLLYHVLLVLWTLTFEKEVTDNITSEYPELLDLLLSLIKSAIKEKIGRLSIGIIANLVRLSPEQTLPRFSIIKPLRILEDFKPRYNADQDVLTDIDFLIEQLTAFLQEQTNFAIYKIEVMNSKLHWSAPHRSDRFWLDNAEKIVEDESIINKLVETLRQGLDENGQPKVFPRMEDYTPLQVACHDFAEILTVLPHKREVLDRKHVKAFCLGLMSSANPELRYEALSVVQLFLRHAFSSNLKA